jgi:thymidylate kinase
MIVEIGGMDGSGKTIQVSYLFNYFTEKGKTVYIPKPIYKFNPKIPQYLENRIAWYMNENAVKVVEENLKAAKARNYLVQKIGSEYVLLDRGYYTTWASMVARLDGKDPDSIVDYIARDLNFYPIEDKHIIYEADFDTIKKRTNPSKSFELYLVKFKREMDLINDDEAYKVDATKSRKEVFDITRKIIES